MTRDHRTGMTKFQKRSVVKKHKYMYRSEWLLPRRHSNSSLYRCFCEIFALSFAIDCCSDGEKLKMMNRHMVFTLVVPHLKQSGVLGVVWSSHDFAFLSHVLGVAQFCIHFCTFYKPQFLATRKAIERLRLNKYEEAKLE